jgi:hypothetical protein
MKKKVPRLKTDRQAEAFWAQDLSGLHARTEAVAGGGEGTGEGAWHSLHALHPGNARTRYRAEIAPPGQRSTKVGFETLSEPEIKDSHVSQVCLMNVGGTQLSYAASQDFRGSEIAGTFVFHCHILEHEDAGIMGSIEVLAVDTQSIIDAPPIRRAAEHGRRQKPIVCSTLRNWVPAARVRLRIGAAEV